MQAGLLITYFDYWGYSARHQIYSFYSTIFYIHNSFLAIIFFAWVARREEPGLREMLLALPVSNRKLLWGKFFGNYCGFLPLALEGPLFYIALSVYRGSPGGEILANLPGLIALFTVPQFYSAVAGFFAALLIRSRSVYLVVVLYWIAAGFLTANRESLVMFQGYGLAWLFFSDFLGTFPVRGILAYKTLFYGALGSALILAIPGIVFSRRAKPGWPVIAGAVAIGLVAVAAGYGYFRLQGEERQAFLTEMGQYQVSLAEARAESEKYQLGREQDFPATGQPDFKVESYRLNLVYNADNRAAVQAEIQVKLPPQLPRSLVFTLRRNLVVSDVTWGSGATASKISYQRQGDLLEIFLPPQAKPGIVRIGLKYQGLIRGYRTKFKDQVVQYYFVGNEGAALPSNYGWYPFPGRRVLSRAFDLAKARSGEFLMLAEGIPATGESGKVIAEMTPNEEPADFRLRVTAPAGAGLFSNLERRQVTERDGWQVAEFAGDDVRGVLLIGGNLDRYKLHDITFYVAPDYAAYLEPLAAKLAERVNFYRELVPGSDYRLKLLVLPAYYADAYNASALRGDGLTVIPEYALADLIERAAHGQKLVKTGQFAYDPIGSGLDSQLLSTRWKAHDRRTYRFSNPVATGLMEYQFFLFYRETLGEKEFEKLLADRLRQGNNQLAFIRSKGVDSGELNANTVLARLVELETKEGLDVVRAKLGRLYDLAQQRSLTPGDFWLTVGLDERPKVGSKAKGGKADGFGN